MIKRDLLKRIPDVIAPPEGAIQTEAQTRPLINPVPPIDSQAENRPLVNPPVQTLGGIATFRPLEPMPDAPVINPPPPINNTISSMEPVDKARMDYERELAAPVKKQSPAKQALFMALQALGNVATGQNKPIEWLGNAKKQANVDAAARVLGPLQQQEQVEQQRRLREAQIATIPIDDENKRLQILNQRQNQVDRNQIQALSKVNSLKYYDPKNGAHRRLAQAAGLDVDSLQGWDDRNPIIKQVAGISYKLNRQTGAFEPTNLPADETKSVTDYKVTMPNGETRTYRVAQKDAANFSTQMSALGARLEQQESQFKRRLALSQAQFDNAKSEFKSVMDLRERTFQAQEEARRSNDQNKYNSLRLQLEKYDSDLEKMLQRARQAHSEGELDDNQLKDIEDFVTNKRQ